MEGGQIVFYPIILTAICLNAVLRARAGIIGQISIQVTFRGPYRRFFGIRPRHLLGAILHQHLPYLS